MQFLCKYFYLLLFLRKVWYINYFETLFWNFANVSSHVYPLRSKILFSSLHPECISTQLYEFQGWHPRKRALNPINRDRYRVPQSQQRDLRPANVQGRSRGSSCSTGREATESEISRRSYKAQTAAIRSLGSNNAIWARLRGVS